MNNFKQLLISVLLFIPVILTSEIYADNNENENTSQVPKHLTGQSTAKLKHHGIGNRMPSKLFIEFLYGETGVEFLQSELYTSLNVEICDDEMVPIWCSTITSNNSFIGIVLDSGTYTVTCTNEQGQIFVGYFEL